MTIDSKKLKRYIANNMNIMLVGPAGTGKTTVLKEACKDLNLTLKYSQASTMDVFSELIGIPVPNTAEKQVEFYRPHAIDNADVLFIDELNRADARTLNTIFELVQFRSINGEPLPKLKCVVTAINPATDDYEVEDLDLALMDRFDAFLEIKPGIDIPYFSKIFNEDVAYAAKQWWDSEYKIYRKAMQTTENQAVYISPRRMEKMVAAYRDIRNLSTLQDTRPYGSQANMTSLKKALDVAFDSASSSAATAKDSRLRAVMAAADPNQLIQKKATLKALLEDTEADVEAKNKAITHCAGVLNSGIRVSNLINQFEFVVDMMTTAQKAILTNNWSAYKLEQIQNKTFVN